MSNPGLTVITATGHDYTVPKAQSWSSATAPTGELLVEVYDGPFVEAAASDPRSPVKAMYSGSIIGSFSDVEGIYPTDTVTHTP